MNQEKKDLVIISIITGIFIAPTIIGILTVAPLVRFGMAAKNELLPNRTVSLDDRFLASSTQDSLNQIQPLRELPQSTTTSILISTDNFSLAHDTRLNAAKSGRSVLIRHFIPYTYSDPCDGTGEAPQKTELVDFNVSITTIREAVENVIKSNKWTDTVQEVTFGTRTWKMVEVGAEGCGLRSYFYQLPDGRTLTATHSLVPELSEAINPSVSNFLALPGVISPEESEKMLSEILSSIVVSKVSASNGTNTELGEGLFVSTTTGNAPLTITFSGVPPNNPSISFGDGTSCTDMTETEAQSAFSCTDFKAEPQQLRPHTYTKPGTYTLYVGKLTPSSFIASTTITVK